MKKRQVFEIAIYPKLFNVVSFYSKGQYSVKISIVQQDLKGKLSYAYPKLIELRDSKTHQNKKATALVQKDNANYTTEQFYITYNEETIFLNTMATFTFQYEENKFNKTYIDFKLLLTKYKVIRKSTADRMINSDVPANIQPTKKVTEVDSRRIYLNKLSELNCFKKIIFSDCQYFSYLDTYIGCTSLGTKFRPNDFDLTSFYCMETQVKTKYHLQNDERKINLSIQQKGKMIREVTELDLKEFYHQYMSESYNSYCDIRKKFIDLVKMITNSSILGKTHQNIINNDLNIKTTLRTKSQLQNYYETQDQDELFYEILEETNQINQYTKHIWQNYLQLLQNIPFKTFAELVRQNFKKQSLFKERSMVTHSLLIEEQARFLQHQIFLKKRQQIIDNLVLYEDDDIHHPFLMVEGYENSNFPEKSVQINSLVVFVHGYQGSDYDLEKAKNFMNMYCPNCYGLLIKSIQDQIEQNIQLLGEKVANQIKAHIAGSLNIYKRINFLGYSLGGVVVRQAIRNLDELKNRMNIFTTFASPHLGVTKSDNYLVGTGIWYLANVQKIKNMRQLNCQTTLDSNEIIMKKLANCDCLGWFKKVVLVSSKQDNFVPYYSSRIEDKIPNQQIKQMAQSIKKRVQKLQRMEVWFDVAHDIGTFDKMLGRRAHIEFLQNRIFLDIFFKMYGPYL